MNKMLAADDQEVVEALPADGPDPAFGDRVGSSRQMHPMTPVGSVLSG
jgi:hypothetical protein